MLTRDKNENGTLQTELETKLKLSTANVTLILIYGTRISLIRPINNCRISRCGAVLDDALLHGAVSPPSSALSPGYPPRADE